jgi:hypothetical protein
MQSTRINDIMSQDIIPNSIDTERGMLFKLDIAVGSKMGSCREKSTHTLQRQGCGDV